MVSAWPARLALMTATISVGCTSETLAPPASIEPPKIPIPERPWMDPDLPPVIDRGDFVEVPREHWDAITKLRDEWAQYPALTSGSIDDCNTAWQVIIKAPARAQALRNAADQIEAAGWPLWKVIGVVVGFSFGAAAVGFAGGVLASIAGALAL